MEARIRTVSIALLAICSIGATDRSRNFVVTAPTPEIAKQVARQAEIYRHKLAVEWLGKPLPDWRYPCTVNVRVGQIGAGGATTFVFDRGMVGDFKMNIQGSLERILDSVLPHEVNHTIFAEHFRRPLPRWADEGAATFVEDESERRRQMLLAMQVLNSPRRIPLRSLLAIMEYPKEMTDVLHLYAEGYVMVELLIQNGGRAKFLSFLKAAHIEGWDRAFHTHYGYAGVDVAEREWGGWVLAGCPARTPQKGIQVAVASPQQAIQNNVVARSQAPEREPVSVEDQAPTSDGIVFTNDSPNRKRGEDLEAPRMETRNELSEPRMLADVDLGPGERFPLVSHNPQNSTLLLASNPQPYRPVSTPGTERRNSSERGRFEDTIELTDAESSDSVIEPQEPRISRPSTQRPPKRSQVNPLATSTKPTTYAHNRSRMISTPEIRQDVRPELGQARPFPGTASAL